MTLIELKALYYDTGAEMQRLQGNQVQINNRIAALQKAGLQEEPKPEPAKPPQVKEPPK